MLKMFKRFRPIDWGFVIAIIGLTILQVWCTMMMVDYMADLIGSITYLSYKMDPSQLGEQFMAIFNSPAIGGDWDKLVQMLQSSGAMDSDALSRIAAIAESKVGDIWYNGGMMLLVTASCAIIQTGVSILASVVAAHFATSTRSDLNNKVSEFGLFEINKFSTASLVTRSTNDIEQVQMTMLLMMRMVFAAPITAIWAICKIESTSWQLTIAVALAIVLLVVALSILMVAVLPKFKVSQRFVDRLNGITRENINGIRVVHAYNAEGYQEKKFAKANDDLTKLNLFTGRMIGLLSPIMIIIMDGVTLAIYWIGASLINAGEIDYATVTSFTMLATQIIMSFMMLLMMFVLWPRASVSAKRINEVIGTKPSIVDPANPMVPEKLGTIEFDHVSFRYADGEDDVLHDISFKAEKGQVIAIIGATGSGKSTLVNLIARLFDATGGTVKVDGTDVKQMSQKELRSRIGFVPQRGLLFSGTIATNIAFGEDSLSEEKMKEAADVACASEFIAKMDGGFNAPIAQGGTNVSGGQRQRLCIARAVATDPEIYVFDDSFSALDFKTDLAVRTNIREHSKDATRVIVAQRIGTIMDADLIIVLDEGKAVGMGTHEQLLKDCPTYRDIALSQLSKEELGL